MIAQKTQTDLEKLLLQNNLVTQDQLVAIKSQLPESGRSLPDALIAAKLVKSDDIAKLLALVLNVAYVDLSKKTIPLEVLQTIPKSDAVANEAVAFELQGDQLSVAMVEPDNLASIDFLSRKSGKLVRPFIATKDQIDGWLSRYQENFGSEVASALTTNENEEINADQGNQKVQDKKQLQTIVQDAPITRALNSIIEYAINVKASDIHIEPRQNELKIRFRVDGILQEVMTLPKTIEPALVSRIKILSKLKIDEHRMAQDGEAQYKLGGREVDLRIAIAPITYGEQVVIRLLDKSDQLFKLESLGLVGTSYQTLLRGIAKPHGMILSTGPTGSGKSTTLYAAIQEIISPKINIVTLEDPVEYKIAGVNQIQVNNEVGLNFASGLRSILRQDPNVIMVGEIRDHETADLAVQSALTGHLVLSTLHTNSAAGVLPRMLDMKIEPYLIASTINTCIGQRLVRKICENCKQGYAASPAAIKLINTAIGSVLESARESGYANLPKEPQNAYTLYKGQGCDQCQDGFAGRTGLYEVFEMNAEIEKLLLTRATTSAIAAQAKQDGMLTMQQDGILKVLAGITTLTEVGRVASDT